MLARARQFRLIAFDKSGAFDKILWRITAQAKFRKHSQIRAARLRLNREFQYPRRIALKIANGGIELCEGDLHER